MEKILLLTNVWLLRLACVRLCPAQPWWLKTFIAFRIQLDSPAVTGVIDRLVKENLVERLEDPSDRRSLQILLTLKGRQLAEESMPMSYESNAGLQAGFKPDEIDLFEKLLSRLEQKF
jgi:DNA-binding MarR family transcriptional regulator